jgi:hypothetical protein
MVWSQYVYEANANTDALPSDEDEYDEDVHLTIEDWQIKYSDELWELWGIVEQLIHDAFLEGELMTECTFSEFAEFCSTEHTDDCHFVWIPYESNLSYIWRHIQDFLEDTGLYNEFMPGATYDHWVRFAYQHTKQNNVSIY